MSSEELYTGFWELWPDGLYQNVTYLKDRFCIKTVKGIKKMWHIKIDPPLLYAEPWDDWPKLYNGYSRIGDV